jgi:hypothetical protein
MSNQINLKQIIMHANVTILVLMGEINSSPMH